MVSTEKTLIGILASRDSERKNSELAEILAWFYDQDQAKLAAFHLVFTGGTFDRLVLGKQSQGFSCDSLTGDAAEFIRKNSTRLPAFDDGGITLLACLIVQRKIRILLSFLDPVPGHWLVPENIALLRLSNIWGVKTILNRGSAERWFATEAQNDRHTHKQVYPLELYLPGSEKIVRPARVNDYYEIPNPCASEYRLIWPATIGEMVIALIAHDRKKVTMLEFVQEFEPVLKQVKRVLATSPTAHEVAEQIPEIEPKMFHYRSGPRGGDIEIASEILYGRVHAVVFLIDPMEPHPHVEDVRTLLGASAIQDQVQLLTNEQHARSWMKQIAENYGIPL